MTQIVGDATHIQGKPLSGNPSPGQGWMYDGTKYVPGVMDGDAAVTELENTVVMMAWDLYSEDYQFPDIAVDDFEDEAGIDQSAGVYTYHAEGHYCSDIAPTSGNNTDLPIQTAASMSIQDGLYIDEAAHQLTVNQSYDPNGANNPSTTDATPAQTDAATPYTITESSINGVLSGWLAFDHILSGNNGWVTATPPSEADPHWVKIDFGSGNSKVFNKWRYAQRAGGNAQYPPRDFKLQGSNDDSGWSDLDVRSGVGAPGTGNYTPWFGFMNSSGYQYYRVRITLANGTSPTLTDIGEIELVEAESVTPSGIFAAHTTDQAQLDTTAWSAIHGIDCAQSTPGDSVIYHAISFNKGVVDEKWKVCPSSVWRDIVRLNSGVWQYQDAVWVDADTGGDGTNSRLNALNQAFHFSQNRMNNTALEALNTEFASVFTAGTLDFALGMQADGDNVPTFNKYTVTHSNGRQDLVLVTNDWEAREVNPAAAYVVFKMESSGIPDSDIKAWVSTDDGAHYEQVSGLKTIVSIGNFTYVRGDVPMLEPHGDKTMRLKITGHNSTSVNLHAVALGVRYS